MRIARNHSGKQQLFALLSLADLSLTWWLLSGTRGQVYESNPLARWWLEEHGWLGLAGFKGGTVLLVIGLAAVVARHHPRAGDRILTFASAILGLVVLYSASLGFACLPTSEDQQAFEKAIEKSNLEARAEMRKVLAYRALRRETCEEWLAGRLTLRDAVERMAASERGRDPAWWRILAFLYEGRPLRECLAAELIRFAMDSRREDPAAGQLADRLEWEFELTFGRTLPRRIGRHEPSEESDSPTDVRGRRPTPRRRPGPGGFRAPAASLLAF
jgi:hypothetical protein